MASRLRSLVRRKDMNLRVSLEHWREIAGCHQAPVRPPTTQIETTTGVRLILRVLPTVESVYGGQTLERLKENSKTADCWFYPDLKFEWTGEFRKVEKGEYFLSAPEGKSVVWNDSNIFTKTYRLIMRKYPTIKEIYGKELSELTPPIGYRFTGEFRVPLHMEPCMHPRVHTEIVRYPNLAGDPQVKPRLILEKLPTNPTIKDVYGTDTPDLPQGWKMKEFRQIKAGEDIYYLGYAGSTRGPITDRPLHARDQICYVDYWKDGWRIVLEKELDLSTLTCTVTPAYIYGPALPKVPAGYQVVGFRPPIEGELYLSAYGVVRGCSSSFDRPRLILSPLGPR